MDDERANGYDNGRPKYKQFSKRPVRPDFTARDAQLKVLQAKVKDYSEVAKAKTAELEALQNENKASNKLESLKRSLANAQHSRVQAQVRHGSGSVALQGRHMRRHRHSTHLSIALT